MPKHEYGREGAYLQNEVLKRLVLWVLLPLFVTVVMLGLILTGQMPWFCLLPFVLLIPAMPGLMKRWEHHADKALDPYIKGFGGERDVADALRVLGDDCYLVHDLDFGHGNVDHVAVTPAGIFTIETKAYAGSVWTKGDKLYVNRIDLEKDLKQAYGEAYTVRDFLMRVSGGRPHTVTPLMVFSQAKTSAYGTFRGVHVMSIARLAEFLASERHVLDGPQRSAIAAALATRVSVGETARVTRRE
jgi:hypothetical protein